MRIAVVSLFPVMLREALMHGVLGRAIERGVLEVDCIDPRDFATDVHRTVDDRPYGGGPGMAPRGARRRSETARGQSARVLGCGRPAIRAGHGARSFALAGIDFGGRTL